MHARHLSVSYRVAVGLVRPTLQLLTRRHWRGAEHLPTDRGFVVCSNHLSHLDPFTLGHFLVDHGAPPRFLAKEELFRVPVGGRIVSGAGQIPVYRETSEAGHALAAAVDAVRAGECVVIYPEGTLTRDPLLWPMSGKTGAARVARLTGCPVIPVAQWGVQEILAPYARRPRLLPRHAVHVWAGPPVQLPEPTLPTGEQAVRDTDTILDVITGMLAELRGQQPPAGRWDPVQRARRTPGREQEGR